MSVKEYTDVNSYFQQKALIISALCHDVDHGGFTNNFLQMTNDILVQLYEESPLENHHYYMTMTLMGDNKLLTNVTESEFKDINSEIKDAILATDLAMYFRARGKLLQIFHENLFDWDNRYHRFLIKSIMMTCCDLSGQCKPYSITKKITENLYSKLQP